MTGAVDVVISQGGFDMYFLLFGIYEAVKQLVSEVLLGHWTSR